MFMGITSTSLSESGSNFSAPVWFWKSNKNPQRNCELLCAAGSTYTHACMPTEATQKLMPKDFRMTSSNVKKIQMLRDEMIFDASYFKKLKIINVVTLQHS
jgi:hypothetical protein